MLMVKVFRKKILIIEVFITLFWCFNEVFTPQTLNYSN